MRPRGYIIPRNNPMRAVVYAASSVRRVRQVQQRARLFGRPWMVGQVCTITRSRRACWNAVGRLWGNKEHAWMSSLVSVGCKPHLWSVGEPHILQTAVSLSTKPSGSGPFEQVATYRRYQPAGRGDPSKAHKAYGEFD